MVRRKKRESGLLWLEGVGMGKLKVATRRRASYGMGLRRYLPFCVGPELEEGEKCMEAGSH